MRRAYPLDAVARTAYFRPAEQIGRRLLTESEMCKDCLRVSEVLLPNATEEERAHFLWSATSFPFGTPRSVYKTARQSLRAGGWTINGAIRYAHLELDRGMRKAKNRDKYAT